MPHLVDLLQYVEVGVFGALGTAGVVQWRRRRGAPGRWLAMVFCVLGLVVIGSSPLLYPSPAHPAHVPVSRGLAAIFLCVPYLQYRFMATFSPTRRLEETLVGVGTTVLVVGALLVPGFPATGQPYSTAFAVLVAAALVHWVAITLLVAARLWREGRAQPSAARQRMRTLAAGSLSLGLAVVLSGAGSSGARESVLDVLLAVLALVSGAILLVGFAPPPMLRALWRRQEEAYAWQVKGALMEALNPGEVAAACVDYASRLFGGHGAVLAGQGGAVLGSHGLAPGEARDLAAVAAAASQGVVADRREQVLAVPCRHGWLAVQANAYTPFFGDEEVERLRSVAALAELALTRAELHALVRSGHQQLVEAQALAQVGSWEWDVGSDTVRWSEELYRIHGLPVRPAGQGYEDVVATVHPDDRETFEQTVRTACQDGRPFAFEHRIVRPDGAVALLHSRGKVVTEGGRPLRLLGTSQDVTERRRLEDAVAYQALHDPLTDLANRALLTERLSHALNRRDNDDRPMAVLLLDLDDFKAVNDTLGHGAGDELLRAVAVTLQALARSVDTVARLGGDEFALLLEDTDLARATAVAERVRAALARPIGLLGTEVVVHASIGIFVGAGPVEAGEFLRNADAAMYAAKGAGKDGYQVFEDGMHAALSRRLQLRADLQRAIEGGELRVVFQPVVSLEDGAVVSVEALARWQHPDRGMVGPQEFIPLAEESGLIVALGDWVLCEAVRQLAAWRTQLGGLGPLGLHVNVSARQLREPGVVQRFAAILDEAALDPSLLTVEITESVLVGEGDAAVERLWELRELGVRVAIDDFGTGYSSLSYLQRLPIDTLKIDKAFVDGVNRGPEEAALAHAIVKIATTLRLHAIAEGVETATQASRLRAIGCASAQGFLFSRPLAAAELLALLASQRQTAVAAG